MITFLSQIKDTRTQICNQQKWEELTTSSNTKLYIEQFRKTGQIDWKQRLPAVNFHGYDPKVYSGGYGSRKQADLVPTGLFMLDVDHIDNPKAVWQLFKQQIGEQFQDVALAHITPSGKGLRIVMKGREGSTIKEDQAWLAAIICVQHDECTKDLSRWSFVPMKSDILFINPQILFKDGKETSYNTTRQGERTAQHPQGYKPQHGVSGEGSKVSSGESRLQSNGEDSAQNEPATQGNSHPQDFSGIPYSRIVQRLIQRMGGTPEEGSRHQRIIDLANALKSICDYSVDWLTEIIPDFDKPYSEKKNAVIWAVQHQATTQNKLLTDVLKELQEERAQETTDQEDYFEEQERKQKELINEIPKMPTKLPTLINLLTSKVMPFQRPATAQMVFPALAAHVADSVFINNENKKFELALMGVLVGKQSVGKGCIDAPIECIIDSILADDERAREIFRAWAESQQNKKANEKGTNRPQNPIRIFNTDTTPAALLANLFNAEHYGYAKNLCCFTKCEEIEEMYDMAPTSGRTKISQLIKKTFDRGRIGSERFTASAANYTTVLRWNWCASCTPERAKAFFKRSLTDGTLSRVDFATIIPAEEEVQFIYGDYDETFVNDLKPYIDHLREFRCEVDPRGKLKPFRLAELAELEWHMDTYIKQYSAIMPDDTWRNYAWRTKLNALKKILVLYIANGCKWEEEFEPFFWWTFHYGMWVKMNLFYEKAREAFGEESLLASVSIKSPLELVGDTFTRAEFYKACKEGGFPREPRKYLHEYKKYGRITEDSKDVFTKSVRPSVRPKMYKT